MKISILERDSLGMDVDMSAVESLGDVTVYMKADIKACKKFKIYRADCHR